MKVGPPRGKRRKVASVASATRTSARLKVMNKSGKDEHPVTKGSKTSGRGGGKGKKGKREKGKKGKREKGKKGKREKGKKGKREKG